MPEIGVTFNTVEAVYIASGGPSPQPPSETPLPVVSASPKTSGPRTKGLVLSEGPRRVGGGGDAPSSRIYERLLIKPSPVIVGHVTDTIEKTAIIWNTHAAQRASLVQILPTGDQGITLAGIAPLDVIKELLDVEITYTITTDGPISIAALFRYLFDIGEVSHELLGSRGVVILTRPLGRGYLETRSYDSDLFRSSGGIDYVKDNVAPGDPPRTEIDFPLTTLTVRDRARLGNVLMFGAQYPIGVPLWSSLSRLDVATDGTLILYCPTAMRRFEAGKNLVIMSRRYPRVETFAFRLIDEVGDGFIEINAAVDADLFEAGDFVLPILSVAVPNDLQLTSRVFPFSQGMVTFEEVEL